jgi:Flp pilus assembly protein TadD
MLRRLIPLTIGLLLLASTPLLLAQTVEQLFEQGKAAQEVGNYTEAERLFRQASQLDRVQID